MTKIVAGLGNPGDQYQKNRHNIGFMCVDVIAQEFGFSSWKAKFQSLMCEGRLAGEKIILLKPQTYMNESGRAVRLASDFYKVEPDQTYIFHDELDLVPGKMRVKFGGGHAGHNGLRSIQAHLGTPDFTRVRLGIGHPGQKDRVHGYVLSDFAAEERKSWLVPFIDACASQCELLLSEREEDYMTRVAGLSPVPGKEKDKG